MRLAGIALSCILVLLSWRHAGRDPRHRPAALFVTANLGADMIRRLLAYLNAPAYEAAVGAPLTGWARCNFHVEELLALIWPFGLAALACLVFSGGAVVRRVVGSGPYRAGQELVVVQGGRCAAGLAGGLWALAWAVLVTGYPTIRRAALGRFYLAVELLALLVVIGAGASWWRRRERPTLVEATVIFLGAVELGAVLGWAPFAKGWDWQATLYLAGYGALVIAHGMVELWGARPVRS